MTNLNTDVYVAFKEWGLTRVALLTNTQDTAMTWIPKYMRQRLMHLEHLNEYLHWPLAIEYNSRPVILRGGPG